jgi:hypothetical protein
MSSSSLEALVAVAIGREVDDFEAACGGGSGKPWCNSTVRSRRRRVEVAMDYFRGGRGYITT